MNAPIRIGTLAWCVACGAGSTSGPAPQLDPAPALDCAALTERIVACIDPFEAAYARTEDAGRRGATAPGAPPDGAAGAATLTKLYRDPAMRPAAVEYCTQAWSGRDPDWRSRLTRCAAESGCDAWAACAAPAIGDPMGPNPG